MSTVTDISPDRREQVFWRNVSCHVVWEVFWGSALPMLAPGAIMAIYLHRLGATGVIVGLLPAMQRVCFGLAQLPGVAFASRHERRAPTAFRLYTVAAATWLIAAALASTISHDHPGLMAAALIGCAAVAMFWEGMAMPSWADLAVRFFPDTRRGLALGIFGGITGLAGLGGGWAAQYLLGSLPYPYNFAALFACAGLLQVVGTQFMWLTVEVLPPREATPPPRVAWLRVLGDCWRSDKRLRRLVATRMLFELGIGVQIFFAVHAVERFDLTDQAAGLFALVIAGSGSVGGLLLGVIGDRRGYRRVLAAGMVAGVVATLIALTAPGLPFYYLAFACQGAAGMAIQLGTISLLIEATPPEHNPSLYQAFYNTLMCPAAIIGPVAAGLIGDRYSIPHAFAVALVLQVAGYAALVMLVDDPRRPGQRVLAWTGARWRSLPRYMR